MHLESLNLLGFKNIREEKLEFCKRINCITGTNGMGKTNILDAIYSLAFSRSFFNTVDTHNIAFGEEFFMLQGNFTNEKLKFEIILALKKGNKKQIKNNGKEYPKISDHFGVIPLVMSSPNDIELIYEGSEARRRFFDSIISQCNKIYLEQLIAYNKILAQRNAMLKNPISMGDGALEIWDEQLVLHGEGIHKTRIEFIKEFIPLFAMYYAQISQKAEEVKIQYNNTFNAGEFAKTLSDSLQKDIRMQYTGCGIHRDDFVFLMNDYPLKRFSSQGQQKSFLLALRFAQFNFLRQHKGELPILILDDIFDKLDDLRFYKLIEMISGESFGQVFISDTQEERIRKALEVSNVEKKFFQLTNGKVSYSPNA